MTPEFKYDWFSPIRADMERFVSPTLNRILEIGSFEGQSTRFFLERCPSVTIACVDHFLGGEDQQDLDLKCLLQRFQSNINDYKDRVQLYRLDSWGAWMLLPTEGFDLIFVDGSHLAPDVLNDLCQSYRCVRQNGLIIADDYSWENQRSDCPRVAIEAFLTCFKGRVRTLYLDRIAVMQKVC
jgi:predicted O-methyltransferase YrrM